MAKGDQGSLQNASDKYQGTAWNNNQNQMDTFGKQNQAFQNAYTNASAQNWQDYLNNSQTAGNQYGSMTGMGQGQYGNLAGLGQGQMNTVSLSGTPMRNFGAYGGYSDLAATGGYSPDQIAAIRQRANSPIAAAYAQAQSDLSRQKALTGGYMPNYAGALAKMTQQQSINAGNQAMSTEAALADSIRQGKIAGLGGMTNIDTAMNDIINARLGLGNQAYANMAGATNQAYANLGNITNNAIDNMIRNYAATPGQASMTGQQLNQSGQLNLGAQQNQNQLANAIVNAQFQKAQIPGNFQQAMGNIGSVFGLASSGANTASVLKKLFTGAPSQAPSYPSTGPGMDTSGGDNSTTGQFPTYPGGNSTTTPTDTSPGPGTPVTGGTAIDPSTGQPLPGTGVGDTNNPYPYTTDDPNSPFYIPPDYSGGNTPGPYDNSGYIDGEYGYYYGD